MRRKGEALDGKVSIGRAYRIREGPLRGMCAWCMYATRPYVDLRFTRWGEAATKREGKLQVAEAYAELLRRAAGSQP